MGSRPPPCIFMSVCSPGGKASSSSQDDLCVLWKPCVCCGAGGVGWNHMALEEKPGKSDEAASWVVAGAAAGPASFISRCLGLRPHMVSRRF